MTEQAVRKKNLMNYDEGIVFTVEYKINMPEHCPGTHYFRLCIVAL
jgi:hypothetical protein